MRSKRTLSLLGAGLVSFSAASLDAAPKLRVQVDQRGDFVLLGNTLAHDCKVTTVAPEVGTVGSCGNWFTDDSGVDVFWRSDAPSSGQASTTMDVANARSTAMLVLPAGATITHAYLYWAAAISNGTSADGTATIERPGGASEDVNAIESYTATSSGQYAYQSVADVTEFVKANGSGAYRVSGVSAMSLQNVSSDTAFAGWWMAVFYTLPSDPQRNLALFDGLDPVSEYQSASVTLSGFRVPNAGFDGKLGVVAFEGDNHITGDSLRFRGTALNDGLNSSNNFFNSTRSYLGAAVSNTGDLPKLKGTAASMSGFDLDVVNVTSLLQADLTSAQIQATSTQDAYFLGGFITSISTYKPDFTASTKTATDLNGAPLVVGDTLEYTITVTNTGNDTAVTTIVTDPLPAGVTYVPGTLQIVEGPNAGAKTDAAGDDQAEYDPATRTVIFRAGTGANASQGGTMSVGQKTVLKFQVQVNESGTLSNQATISAAGQQGAPVSDTPTGHNDPGEPTTSEVYECGTDDHCAEGSVCNTTVHPHVCVGCVNDDHCSGTTPTCDPGTNACVCVPTNGGVEICDGIDNDCNGLIDEGFNLGAACQVGQGVCQAQGVIVCGGMGGAVCNAVAGQPSAEVCDGLDNDCDGTPDNGFDVGASCSVGKGECQRSGQIVCDGAGGATCNAVAGEPTQEVCDGLDNDCDGTPDNGFDVGASCSVGKGACERSGQIVCDGAGGATCNAVAGEPTQEICDGIDNDCDGTVDNGFDVGAACSSGLGICEEWGQIVCDGSGGAVCNAVAGAPSQEVCGDAFDSDCDGNPNNGCGCLADDECGVGEICDTGLGATYECVPGCRGVGGNGCDNGTVCTSTDASVGSCVQCTEDSHCGGATSGKVCNLVTHTCIDGCRGTDGNGCGNGEVCTSTDGTVGTCVECTEDSHCGDDDSGKVCDTSKNECQDGCRGADGNGCEAGEHCTSTDDTIGSCVECLVDSDCGAVDSGTVCDDATKTCIAGCRGEGFGNGCFGENVVCTSTDATIGSCVGCVADDDCGDATSGKVCDTSTNTCIDGCHGTGGNGCEPDEICTSTDGTIGTCVECVEDSDCGDATSGKVCDTTTNTCTDGCRGTDGNGCEPGETCSSTDDTIGTCEEPGDGGTGGSDAGDAGDGGSDAGDAGDGGTGGTDDDGGIGDGGVGGADAGDDDDAGTGFGADEGDVWATGNGVLCATQPGSAGQGAGWLIGGAAVALALARRRRR